MNDAYDKLPWWRRKKAEWFFLLPKRFQIWNNKRKFWKWIIKGAGEGSDANDCVMRAMASAEFIRLLGDVSLMKRIKRNG